jgi:hypothetical protein
MREVTHYRPLTSLEPPCGANWVEITPRASNVTCKRCLKWIAARRTKLRGLKPGTRIVLDYVMGNGRRNRKAKATFLRLARVGESIMFHDYLVEFDRSMNQYGNRQAFVTAHQIVEVL